MDIKNSLFVKVKDYFHRPYFWCIIYIIISSLFLVYQQIQIDALTQALQEEHTMDHDETFHYRLTNLEHIANAHGDRLKLLEHDTYTLKKMMNQHQFRIMQLEWQHPEVEVVAPATSTYVNQPFRSNPTNTPDVTK